MKITYYGHACFGVTVTNRHLLFDPFITLAAFRAAGKELLLLRIGESAKI